MTKYLNFFAGSKAYSQIKENGLSPDNVKAIYGAAGGPKWLVLNRFDRMLFGDWFSGREKPLYLIGSSIGAWRFSTMSQNDPLAAQQRFEIAYINQLYEGKPSAKEVTEESFKILDAFLPDDSINEILSHPYLRINVITVRCKWPSSSDNKFLLVPGLLSAYLLNFMNRGLLKHQFERVLFYHPSNTETILDDNSFPIHRVKLDRSNYKSALMASGSIPLVMESMKDIPGAPKGIFRDGGLIDYHLDIPTSCDENEIVLYPHFSNRIVPGWLDKGLKKRTPSPKNMENVLLVSPTEDYIKSLPNLKIPDRNDFKLYFNRDQDRFRDWNSVVEEGQKMADEFFEAVSSGKVKERVKPMF